MRGEKMQYGCIGKKLGHSFSAVIHEQLGDYDYQLVELTEKELDEFMQKKDFKGINVTIPYKQAVIPYLDVVDDSAKKIGAVNTIINSDGVLTGYNTDFYGMTELLKKGNIELADRNVFILGTGGTSKTASAVAKSQNAKNVFTVSRNPEKGQISYEEMCNRASEVEVVINTTPVGMYPHNGKAAIEPEKFPNLCGVADAIYNPMTTELVRRSKKCNANAVNGLYMLVAQAVKAAEHFFNDSSMLQKTESVYSQIRKSKLNVVLTGMPGSGKSSVGKLVAKMTGRKFVDTDDVFLKENGEISAFFEKHGEKAFRDKETEIINRLSKDNGMVIATGGGAILREENIAALKQNGIVVFLDRDLEKIVPTSDRPLGNSRAAMEARYNERYPIYTETADIRVESNSEVAVVAESVIGEFDRFCEKEQL